MNRKENGHVPFENCRQTVENSYGTFRNVMVDKIGNDLTKRTVRATQTKSFRYLTDWGDLNEGDIVVELRIRQAPGVNDFHYLSVDMHDQVTQRPSSCPSLH